MLMLYSSVVVNQVYIHCLTILESEDDAPIARYSHAPLATPVTCQWMQMATRYIDITRYIRRFKVFQNTVNAGHMSGIQATGFTAFIESAQPSIPEPHSMAYRSHTCESGPGQISATKFAIRLLRAWMNCSSHTESCDSSNSL